MQFLSDVEMVEQSDSPLGVLVLSEAETGSCEYELVVVVVEAFGVQKAHEVVDKSEIHAGYHEGFGRVRSQLILGALLTVTGVSHTNNKLISSVYFIEEIKLNKSF